MGRNKGIAMQKVSRLVEGYHAFLEGRYPQEAELYRRLGEEGQSPRIMIIACCDSRVDPATIFSAAPGELFIVRNVANLVPPHEPHGDYHGTSAALEFAVNSLGVEHVVVMGHARCGGIQFFLDGVDAGNAGEGFIAKWMSLLNPARGAALRSGVTGRTERLQAVEHEGIRHSIENLKTFPFVRERLAAGTLALHGGYFDVATGVLLSLDSETGEFVPVQPDEAFKGA
jgi:carbonic anhydrase